MAEVQERDRNSSGRQQLTGHVLRLPLARRKIDSPQPGPNDPRRPARRNSGLPFVVRISRLWDNCWAWTFPVLGDYVRTLSFHLRVHRRRLRSRGVGVIASLAAVATI